MEILEAFDLTGSFRDAAELAGCSHHTVAAHVAAREAGGRSGLAAARPQLIDEYLPKIEEWVEHSHAKIRADKAHEKLLGLAETGGAPLARLGWPERAAHRPARRAERTDSTAYPPLRLHRLWV